MTQLRYIFHTYRLFVGVAGVMCLLLFARIPLGTFTTPSSMDIMAHIVLIAAGGPLVTVYLAMSKLLTIRHVSEWMIVATMVGITLEVIWEMFEFVVGLLWGVPWQIDNADTMFDIILGVVGAIAGASLFMKIYGLKPLLQ